MSIVFQGNHVSLLSDAYNTIVIQDKVLEANGEPHIINGVINTVVVTDNNKKTWIFTVPTWENVVLSPGQFVHFEGPREYSEDGATFVCLGISNSGGGQGFLTRQVSSSAHVSHTRAIGEVREKA